MYHAGYRYRSSNLRVISPQEEWEINFKTLLQAGQAEPVLKFEYDQATNGVHGLNKSLFQRLDLSYIGDLLSFVLKIYFHKHFIFHS